MMVTTTTVIARGVSEGFLRLGAVSHQIHRWFIGAGSYRPLSQLCTCLANC